jgi:hypothetical protein
MPMTRGFLKFAHHDDNRSHDLVRDAEDTEQPLEYLEPAAGQYTKSSATKSTIPHDNNLLEECGHG